MARSRNVVVSRVTGAFIGIAVVGRILGTDLATTRDVVEPRTAVATTPVVIGIRRARLAATGDVERSLCTHTHRPIEDRVRGASNTSTIHKVQPVVAYTVHPVKVGVLLAGCAIPGYIVEALVADTALLDLYLVGATPWGAHS